MLLIYYYTHLNWDKIESTFCVPGTQGRNKNGLIKSFQTSPHSWPKDHGAITLGSGYKHLEAKGQAHHLGLISKLFTWA